MGGKKFLYSFLFFAAGAILYMTGPGLLTLLGGPSQKMFHEPQYHLVPVLCFHNLDGAGQYSIARSEFRRQMEILRTEGVDVISLRTLHEHARINLPFKRPSIVLTIDDDYTNIVRLAAPVLREFRYPATFFVYTQAINSSPQAGLSWEDLRRINQEGFDIQNHSYSHTAFHNPAPGESEPDYAARVYREIGLSRDILIKNIPGIDVFAFAYPMGYYSDGLREELMRTGYEVLLTTDARAVNVKQPFNGTFDRFTIQRGNIDPRWLFLQLVQMAKTTPEEAALTQNENPAIIRF